LIDRIHKNVSKILNAKQPESASTDASQARHLRDGQAAERLAETYLARRGLKIITRNVRSRWGEIDLVAADGAAVVFVEVRMRSDPRYGGAAASVSAAKQKRIIQTARWFLAYTGKAWSERPCRFDVILLDQLKLSHIEWIKGAFEAF